MISPLKSYIDSLKLIVEEIEPIWSRRDGKYELLRIYEELQDRICKKMTILDHFNASLLSVA